MTVFTSLEPQQIHEPEQTVAAGLATALAPQQTLNL